MVSFEPLGQGFYFSYYFQSAKTFQVLFQIVDEVGFIIVYCGVLEEQDLKETANNQMYVAFYSDSFGSASGFNLTYKGSLSSMCV